MLLTAKTQSMYIGNHLVVYHNGKSYSLIVNEDKLPRSSDNRYIIKTILNPTHRSSMNSRGFVERINDSYFTNPNWFDNLQPCPSFFVKRRNVLTG